MGKILYLTLYRKWFDCIAAGWKREEYRNLTEYWRKRLIGRGYTEIHFTNGYGKERPWMRVEFKGVVLSGPTIVIRLGRMLDCGNYGGEVEK